MAINVINISHQAIRLEDKVIGPGQVASVSGQTDTVNKLVSAGLLFIGSTYTYPTNPPIANSPSQNAQIVPFSTSISPAVINNNASLIVANITGSFSFNIPNGAPGLRAIICFISATASGTITWGANMKVGAATTNIGASGTSCVWEFVHNGVNWIGDNDTAAGLS